MNSTGFRTNDAPRPDEFMSCIKCGLCLPSCPTFQQTGLEEESPRGRVQLITSVAQELIPLSDGPLADTLFSCLDCRACEIACPSGVPIGTLIEKGRAEVVAMQKDQERLSTGTKLTQRVIQWLMPHPQRLRRIGRFLRLLQRMRMTRLARFVPGLPDSMRQFAQHLHPLPPKTGREMLPKVPDIQENGEATSVSLFLGCVMDVIFADANRATQRVLTRNHCAVSVPDGQVCCGALSIHAGDREGARRLARKNIDAFLANPPQYIATNAGGCGAALLEYPDWLRDDPEYYPKAQHFATMVKDATQILDAVGFIPPTGTLSDKVTYQGSCHLHNVMKVGNLPEQLLQSIPGLYYQPMRDVTRCCGSAGIYNLTHPDMAQQLLQRKMEDIPHGSTCVATANPGCWMQMEYGSATIGPKVAVRHVMELLDAAYDAGERMSSP